MRSRTKSVRGYFLPIAGMGLFCAVVAFFGPLEFARRIDLAAKVNEERAIARGVTLQIRDIADRVLPIAVWDTAVAKLDNRFDKKFAQNGIGAYLRDAGKFSFSYVLNGRNEAISAMGKAEMDPRGFAEIAPAATPLIEQVRQKELNGAREPNRASAVANVGGQPFILTVTLVAPDLGTVRIRNAKAPIIVTGMPINGTFTWLLAQRYALAGAELKPASYQPDIYHTAAPLTDSSGIVLAKLTWWAASPGGPTLAALIPYTATLAIGLMALTIVLFRRARRAADGLAESEARATHMAFHDSMTGLANRVRLEQALSRALANYRRGGEAFAVQCIDLDRFKELNDTYGHQAGDELLKAVAQRLKSLTSGEDITARLGGDEFAIVQIGATREKAAELGDAIVRALSEPFEMSVGVKRIGCSVGVTLSSENVTDPLEFVRQADLALYRAKGGGRGQYCVFEPHMDAANRSRRLLQEDLRAAMGTNQLRMVYQPQVIKSGKVVGVEALLRWTHPERGAISPTIFIPVAEESGLMVELGEYALRQVFRDSVTWPDLKVAVNVSAMQIQTSDFAKRLAEIVREEKADPTRFELEITESVLLGDDEAVHDTLTALRTIGFSLALDDFGTGYSSLSYLRRFPINKIKIDRSFVTNLGVDSEADAVVGAIVRLARALNLAVIAEGVETTEQWRHLQRAGCAEIQGFVAHRPMEAHFLAGILLQQLSKSAVA